MTREQKIIRTKVGVLELAKQLGNVSKVCQLPISFTTSHFLRHWGSVDEAERWRQTKRRYSETGEWKGERQK